MIRLVASAGFDPATFAVSGRRPNQASPTLRSVLDDEPRRHRQSYSVSSFPENSTCDSYREKRLTFYRLQKLEAFMKMKSITITLLAIGIIVLITATPTHP